MTTQPAPAPAPTATPIPRITVDEFLTSWLSSGRDYLGGLVDRLNELTEVKSERDALLSRVEELTEINEELESAHGTDLGLLLKAVHMMHEDAHGDAPLRLCSFEPCRDLAAQLHTAMPTGPSQLSLAGVSR